MTSLSSILSSVTTKDPKKADVARVSLKLPDSSKKAQCDICKLSYSTEKELLEHCLSLIHHNKLENRDENSLHECVLCRVTCSNRTDYRRHVITDIHQKKLRDLKGDKDKKIGGSDDRGSVQTSRYSFLSNSDYGSKISNSANKQFQRDTDFPEKEMQNAHNKINNQTGKHHYRDSKFKYDQSLDSVHSQMWNKGSHREKYPYRNDMYHWSRDAYMDEEYSMQTSDKDYINTQDEQQSCEQASVYSGYHDYNSIGGYLGPWRYENSQDWMRANNMYQCKDLEQTLEDANEIDFTRDVLPADWDEKSLLENEQFLAGIDSGYQSGKHHSYQGSSGGDVSRWYDSNLKDRKRPLNGDDIQESFAKSSRSVDSSSDDSILVSDIPKRRIPLYETPSINKNRPTPSSLTKINALSKPSTIDDASNNILERAERLCKELREKREASNVQRNYLLKKQEHDSLNQRMSALVEKQQLYLKGHISSSEKQQDEESYDSGINSSLGKQLIQNGKLDISRKPSIDSSTAPTPHPRAAGKMHKETNKSTEESMLEGHEKHKSNVKISSLLRKAPKTVFREDAKIGKNSETKDLVIGMASKPLSKLASKPHLTKDSLKKMVNTPNSRDERLQLVKMLQSREGQKTATALTSRASLQLEGLYDSVFDSKELNIDGTRSAQSVNLEDLSFSVRQQILDVIGRDDSCQSISQPETGTKSPGRLPKKISTSLTDVIVLSDDEDLKDVRKNKKNNSKQISSLNSPIVIHYVVKPNKKKKTLTGPTSKEVLKNSVVSSLTSPSVSKSLHVNHSGNLRPTSPVQQITKAHKNPTSHADDTLTVSHSTKSKLGKKVNTFPGEIISHDTTGTILRNKKNFSISSAKNIQKNSSRVDDRSPVLCDQIQGYLNSTNVVDKFPTLLNILKTDRILPLKENGASILSGSEVSNHSSEQTHNAHDKRSDKKWVSSSLQSNFTAVSPKSDVRLSSAQTMQEGPSQDQSSTQIPALQAHKSDTLVLSPSSLLTNQTSSLHICGKQNMSFNDRSIVMSPTSLMSTTSVLPSSFKDFTDKDDTSGVLVLDVGDLNKVDSTGLPGNKIKSASSGNTDGSSSQTMSKLLVLSEKEEHVKHEKMTMDLRLSRLHKLLEQAVVQINMCTDRMNQLHEEEQELSKKRLSILRVATSLTPSWRSDDASPENDTSNAPRSASHDYSQTAETRPYNCPNSNTGAGVSQVSTSSTLPSSTSAPLAINPSDRTENLQGTSLSRSDWLAKFSSYLPKDPVTETSKTATRSYSLVTSSTQNGQDKSAGLNEKTNNSLESAITLQNLPNSLPLNHNFSEKDTSLQQVIDLETRNQELQEKHSLKLDLYNKLSQVASSESTTSSSKQNKELPTHSMGKSAAKLGEHLSHSLISVPIMYLGSFRSTDCPMRLIDPLVSVRTSPEYVLKKPRAEIPDHLDKNRNAIVTSSSCKETANVSTYSSSFADLLQLSSPPRSHIMGKSSEHGGEESDIGSVASSIASGSSLGEQITRYCRATPGASLDSKEPFGAHELSVILSDTSEQMGLDSQEEADHGNCDYMEKKDWCKSVRDCSVSLERLDNNPRKNVYGSLDEKAVKSAEALHLLERNYENTTFSSSSASDIGKRKRRKTKQERDTSDFSRRKHHCIILSSSEEEENGKSKKSFNSDIDSLATQVNGSSQSSCQDNSHIQNIVNNAVSECNGLTKLELDSPIKVTVGSNVTMTNVDFTPTSKTASNLDVTFAEYDSTTSWDIVDLESVNLRINSLKEMGSSLSQRSALFSKSFSPDDCAGVNPSQTDVLFRNDSQLKRLDELSSHSHQDTVKQNSMADSNKLASSTTVTATSKPAPGWTSCTSDLPSHSTIDLTGHSTSPEPELSSVMRKASSKFIDEIKLHDISVINKTSQYPCDYGPVIDICVARGQMYVGHVNRGVRVYNLSGLNQDKCLKEYNFPYLQCMSIKDIDGAVTLILGNGCNLVFCNSTEEEQLKHDLGTTIKCLLSVPPLVYAGLDTGEICIYDTVRKTVRDRCICSDRPIHCLATGQEGTIKLLCVSSQDGTIIVVDAQQCLPLRILTGHTKTAFSIQVEGHRLFSGSGDHTVLIQNVHTAAIEHTYRESKGLIKSVYYSQGYLFTGGMDKLVRCYNVKTHQLVQVYFGADRGVITKILVLGDLLITGSIAGSVQVVDIDFEARHECHVDGCGLNFGNRSHLYWHLLEDHNISSSSRDY